MLWPGGYAGPDAYVGYQTDLENKADFPAAKSVTWMTEAQGQAIKDFVNAGGGFYPMHNSSHISLDCKNYRDVMGGAYIGHPPLRPFEVHATANAHPITGYATSWSRRTALREQDKDPKYLILNRKPHDLAYEVGRSWAARHAGGPMTGGHVVHRRGHTVHAMWNLHMELQKRSIAVAEADLTPPALNGAECYSAPFFAGQALH